MPWPRGVVLSCIRILMFLPRTAVTECLVGCLVCVCAMFRSCMDEIQVTVVRVSLRYRLNMYQATRPHMLPYTRLHMYLVPYTRLHVYLVPGRSVYLPDCCAYLRDCCHQCLANAKCRTHSAEVSRSLSIYQLFNQTLSCRIRTKKNRS